MASGVAALRCLQDEGSRLFGARLASVEMSIWVETGEIRTGTVDVKRSSPSGKTERDVFDDSKKSFARRIVVPVGEGRGGVTMAGLGLS